MCYINPYNLLLAILRLKYLRSRGGDLTHRQKIIVQDLIAIDLSEVYKIRLKVAFMTAITGIYRLFHEILGRHFR